jgi:DNA-binding beta-propeller fold protein YncE
VDASGNVFVADALNNRIEKFTSDSHFIATWGSYGTDHGQFNIPFGVAVDHTGNVFVADTFNSRIQKFTNNGKFLTTWGSPGAGKGQMENPYSLGVDASGNVYVADTGDEWAETDNDNNRVEKFSNDGTFITAWGSYGLGDGQFDNPFGIVVDPRGNVFVVDEENNRIQEFAPCGESEEGCQD